MDDIVTIGTLVDNGTNEVLQQIQILTGKPILRQQNLPTVKISFDQGDKEMTRAQLLRALESLLALNGVALTRVGDDFIKAVPAATINNQVPILWEGSTFNAEATQMIYEKVFKLDFLTTVEVIPLIQPIMSQGSPISLEKSGLILVTDALVNLQRIERILKAIDKPTGDSSEILFFQLKHIDVQEASQRLKQMQTGALRRRLETNTNFDADERTNQLIVFTHRANASLITNLIEKMDIDVAPITTTKVYSIRYAESIEVVSIIDQVISGQKEARDQNTGGNTNPQAARQAAQAAQQQRAANAAAAAVRAEASNLQFSDYLTLVPDERANSIVASGTGSDLKALDNLIEQIDVLLAQVQIEAVIVEVSLSESDSSGISALGIDMVRAGGSAAGQAPTNGDAFTIGAGALGPLGWGEVFFDDFGNISLPLMISAVDTESKGTILSAPTIVTTHNREANISIGERRPIITGTTTSGTSGAVSSQVQYQNIGIELSVTPLIGNNNIIQLEIEQTVEGILPGDITTIDGNDQPIITSRKASSFVSVGDNQLVVLGGLQSLDTQNDGGKFPILGYIPLLDKVFTSKDVTEDRREIILFIRPRIVRTAEEADQMTRDRIDRLQSKDAINDYLDSGILRSFEEYEDILEEDEAEATDIPIKGPRR